MPRPERPLDPEHNLLHAFATTLRGLRESAGSPTYAAMARRTGRSRSALAEAAGGEELPTWETVVAYVTCCDADPNQLLATWEHLRQLRDGAPAVVPAMHADATPGLANLPRRPTTVFVGRDRELRALDRVLHADSGPAVGVAIHGMGGVGKTELALHWAHRNLRRHVLTWWITADSEAGITAGLASLARALCPGWPSTASIAEVADWGRQWLAVHEGWLLVLDNVQDVRDIEDLLALAGPGQVIVTTRRRVEWSDRGLVPLRLKVLPEHVGAALLLQRTGRDDQGAAASLASELGGLPLALCQAAATLNARPHVTMAGYRERLATRPVDILSTVDGLSRQPHPVDRAWQVTVAEMAQTCPRSVWLMDTIAYFAPDDIPVELLVGHCWDPVEVEDAIALAASHSMVDCGSTAISVHRLVQMVIRARHTSTRPARDAVELLAAATPQADPESQVLAWPQWHRLSPHVEVLSRHLASRMLSADRELALLAAGLCYRFGLFNRDQGRYEAAVALFEHSVSIREEHLGIDHPDTITARYGLGGGYWSVGRYAETIAIGEATLEARRRVLGPDHPDTLQNASNIAVGYREVGRHQEAIELSEYALAARMRVLGPEHPETLQSQNNLAGCYRAVGRHGEALALYIATLSARERVLGSEHPDTLQSRHNLAGGYAAVGELDAAIRGYRATLASRERLLGPDHPDTQHSRSGLADCYLGRGQLGDAMLLYEMVHTVRLRKFGADHPETRRALQRLRMARTRSDALGAGVGD